MVEQVMFFALGFFVAGFFAVLLVPALNQRAERLANRRMRALFPVSLEEMTAERDHLRAEFAVTTRIMERKQQRMFEEKTAALADVGKQLSSASASKRQLEETLARLASLESGQADLQSDLESTRQQRDDAIAERDAARPALATLTSQRTDLTQKQDGLTRRVDEQRMAIAELESRVAALSSVALASSKSEQRLADELLAERNGMRILQETLADQQSNAAHMTRRMTELKQGRDTAHGVEMRALRERLVQAQVNNDALRMRAATEATLAVAPATAGAATRAEPNGDIRHAIAVLQGDLAGAPLDNAPATAALRHRIIDVARSIMAGSRDEGAGSSGMPAAAGFAVQSAVTTNAPDNKAARKPSPAGRSPRAAQSSPKRTLR